MNSKLKVILIISCILLIGAGVFFYSHKPKEDANSLLLSRTHLVVLEQNGFVPMEVTIQKGDVVKFITAANRAFWPASDLHPTHTIYPEFDPRRPVESGESWSFRFEKTGTWKYHDHLFFTRRGTIIVSPSPTPPPPGGREKERGQETGEQNWQGLIDKTLEEQGLDQAFQVLGELYSKEPTFALDCHGYVHRLGETAYTLFAEGKEVKLTPKTSYCGFGFYHGFMETLLLTTGDIQEARDFCAYAGQKLAGQTSDAEGACYHGFGHGSVDGGDPRFWGDPQKMTEPGLKLCEQVAGHDTSPFGKLYRCVTGAYNALEILSTDLKYKLDQIVKNPFFLCSSQKPAYQEGCYTNMLPALLRFTKNDFDKAAQSIEQIPEVNDGYEIRSQVILGLFHDFIRVNLREQDYNVKEGVTLCRKLSNKSRLPCIEGLAGGHMKYGEPGKEYVKGLNFCTSSILEEEEQGVCFKHILTRLRIWYTREKSKEICNTVPENFRYHCQ